MCVIISLSQKKGDYTMSNQNVKCKNCGEEISKKAVVCPKCGVKNKKPVYKRGWFIAVAAIVVICAIAAGSGNDSNAPVNSDGQVTENQQEVVYTEYELSQLFDDLENNALNAKNKYNKQYVKLTGELSVIDSNGDYISIDDGGFRIIGVQCYLKNDEQKNQAATMKIGDTVTVKGKIKSVGEVMGYSLDIDSIE